VALFYRYIHNIGIYLRMFMDGDPPRFSKNDTREFFAYAVYISALMQKLVRPLYEIWCKL